MPGLARWRLGVAPKLDITPRDIGMVMVDAALAMATKDMLIEQGIIPADILKYDGMLCNARQSLAGGALVNALAFSGSNYLFFMLRSSDLKEERKRHDQAIEQLQAP